ncbi:hypothetical protein JW933_06135 [candidate division FCPU426 bacterium]|nr:hypothetical protein [candidate division FCPU426 bacterium]
MKRQLAFCSCFFVAIVFYPAYAMSGMVVITDTSIGPYNDASGGISQTIPDITIMDIKKDSAKILSLSADNTDRIITIGSSALDFSKKVNASIPLTYTMVLSPWTYSARPASGVVIKISIADQLNMLKRVFPRRNKIGVIYYPNDSSAQDVKEARDLSSPLNVSLYAIAVEGQSDIPKALSKFTPDTVDVIWLVLTSVTCNFESITLHINHALNAKLPLVGLSASHAKAGALIAFSVDCHDIGVQTALLARSAAGSDSKIVTPRKIDLYVNPDTQKKLNFSDMVLPKDIKLIQY